MSQRLRKRKDILHHHNNSELAPFKIEKPYLVFGEREERQGLLDYLTLTLHSTQYLGKYFEEKPPRKKEIERCIERNFENNFGFFPNNYNRRKKGEPGYSEMIIKKNADSESFQLIDQNFKILKESNILNELISIYLDEELKYKIGEIEIER